MNDPATAAYPGLTQSYAAPQRGAGTPAPPRPRGPHPLPLFLATVTRACAGDPGQLARVLAGLRRYQAAPPPPQRTPRPEVARVGNATLRDHGGTGPTVVIVPSLINPPTVLDLAPGNSLTDGLAARGLHVLMVDWGPPEPMGLAALAEDRLVPLLAGLARPLALVGYCLGGTLALAAAAAAARPAPRVTRLALLATPWHFSGYGAARADLHQWWEQAEPLAQTLGSLPMELLQPAFWQIDPAGLAAKYARFSSAPDGPEHAAFVTLEDWSNGGQPLALPVARALAEDLFESDRPGRGVWEVAGNAVDPAALAMPILDIIAGRDLIVPPQAALTRDGPGTPLRLDAGHVGMLVGRRAPKLLWDPLADWLRASSIPDAGARAR